MIAAEPTSVLIAGCGDLGTEVGLRFQSLGHRVIGVRRRAELLPAGFERQSLDLSSDSPMVPDDVSVVVVALTASARTVEAYRGTYVDGLRNVLRGIHASTSVPRLVVVSSTAVYSGEGGEVIDEQTPVVASSPTSAVLLETEQLAAAYSGEPCLLRLGGIYGPGRERLIEQVRTGTARLPVTSSFTNRIHRDDAARAIVHVALQGDSMPAAVIDVDDPPLSNRGKSFGVARISAHATAGSNATAELLLLRQFAVTARSIHQAATAAGDARRAGQLNGALRNRLRQVRDLYLTVERRNALGQLSPEQQATATRAATAGSGRSGSLPTPLTPQQSVPTTPSQGLGRAGRDLER